MLLAIDARNRVISVGFRSGGAWMARRRIAAAAARSADEYALLLRAFAREAYEDLKALAADGGGAGLAGGAAEAGRVDSAWMSSVVPSLGRELRAAVSAAFGLPCAFVGPGVRTGVRIRTDVPSEVGSDLVCAAAAARELVGGACIVVDFDAAIAFSAIGRGGDFLGVAIVPGIETAAESLRTSAALLPEVPMEGPVAAIGKNTAGSIRAGIAIGYSGLVERIVRQQAEELAALGEADSPGAVAVIGTGGEEGRALIASLGRGRYVPDLVLDGIAIVAARNRPAATVAV
jgi:type III pantothenate kinase